VARRSIFLQRGLSSRDLPFENDEIFRQNADVFLI
jgi:hypothetical protein